MKRKFMANHHIGDLKKFHSHSNKWKTIYEIKQILFTD